jgi:hypothetical protein
MSMLPVAAVAILHASQVTVTCEELSASREEVSIVLAGVQLRNVEVLSKSDPFLEISRSLQVGEEVGGPGGLDEVLLACFH